MAGTLEGKLVLGMFPVEQKATWRIQNRCLSFDGDLGHQDVFTMCFEMSPLKR